MVRRLLAALSLIVAVGAAPASATVVPPGKYYVNVVGGSLRIGTPSPMEFPFEPATLGTIDLPSGDRATYTLALAGQSLRPASAQTAFGPVSVIDTFTQDATGTITRATGELTTSVRVMATVAVGTPVAFTCRLGSAAAPIALELSTQPPGAPMDSALGATIADRQFALPALSGCEGIDDALANGSAGFPPPAGSSVATMEISLVNVAAVAEPPAPPSQPGQPATLPPPVEPVVPKLTIGAAKGAVRAGRVTLPVRCVTAATACTGRLQLLPTASGAALTKAVAFSVPAGRVAGVRLTLRRAAAATLRRRGTLRARARAVVDGTTAPVVRRLVLRGS